MVLVNRQTEQVAAKTTAAPAAQGSGPIQEVFTQLEGTKDYDYLFFLLFCLFSIQCRGD